MAFQSPMNSSSNAMPKSRKTGPEEVTIVRPRSPGFMSSTRPRLAAIWSVEGLQDGEIVARGRYPARTELATWGGATPAGAPSPEGGRKGAPDPANAAAAACCAPPVVSLGGYPAAGRGSSGQNEAGRATLVRSRPLTMA